MSNKILRLLAVVSVCLLVALPACFISPLSATVYFVDSDNGSDQASGRSEAQAWQSLEKVNRTNFRPGDMIKFARGGLWRGSLKSKSGTAGAPITYTSYGPDSLPKPRFYGSLPLNRPTDWVNVETNIWRTVEPVTEPLEGTLSDVGNLIFDGNCAGVKCWSKEQLKTAGHFWFDPETRCVWLVSVANPAETFREIEAALRRDNVIDMYDAHHAVFSDFDVRYGAAHGFFGSKCSYITIRNCDISWIGGGVQYIQQGEPVRFGNGVEFWADAHDHLVDSCRLWEIYDAALTNQGLGKNKQRNITYRNNVIWNCEFSFEYWNRGEESITDNIVFTHNTCFNAGYGWGHVQRPDPNGRHLMFYSNTAKTTNVVVTNNLFAHATESILRVDNRSWTKDLFMDENVWIQQPGADRHLVLWGSEKIHDFRIYQERTGLDRNSIITQN